MDLATPITVRLRDLIEILQREASVLDRHDARGLALVILATTPDTAPAVSRTALEETRLLDEQAPNQ
ncbi:hypothetical protein AB0M43_34920 [Longispora sp. NPDC051575]|uniref:hypothetical protein n=1 Tax=Longispora sp. NPDC051575 TaxID=3154943 RepID=UPI00342E35E4